MSTPTTLAAAACLSALLLTAASPALAQDAAKAEQPVPATRYTSLLDQYLAAPASQHPASHNWVRLNQEVGALDSMALTGGKHGQHGQQHGEPQPAADPHAHHHQPQQHQQHQQHQAPGEKESKQ